MKEKKKKNSNNNNNNQKTKKYLIKISNIYDKRPPCYFFIYGKYAVYFEFLKGFIDITFTAQKKKFSIKDFFSKCDKNPQETADLVSFTKKTLNGGRYFLCSVS